MCCILWEFVLHILGKFVNCGHGIVHFKSRIVLVFSYTPCREILLLSILSSVKCYLISHKYERPIQFASCENSKWHVLKSNGKVNFLSYATSALVSAVS